MSEWKGAYWCERCGVKDDYCHCRTTDAWVPFERRAPDPEVAELAAALKAALPVLKRHRQDMGKIPRPGTDVTFYHSLSYEGDLELLRNARRIHRQAYALLRCIEGGR